MTPAPRRALAIDDPIGSGEACHVAHLAAPGQPDGRLREIAVDEIHPNPDQPRKHFDQEALDSLADSIRERGVLQPIIVRPGATGGYELVARERRWRAARLAGQPTILALVDASVDGAGSLELALIENVVREDLTPSKKPEPWPSCCTTSTSPRLSSRSASAAAAPTSPTRSVCSTYPTMQSS